MGNYNGLENLDDVRTKVQAVEELLKNLTTGKGRIRVTAKWKISKITAKWNNSKMTEPELSYGSADSYFKKETKGIVEKVVGATAKQIIHRMYDTYYVMDLFTKGE